MAVNVEHLEKLERRITLTLPVDAVQNEVQTRLRKVARNFRADGFRPGKVPMGVVAQRYGLSVQHEVMSDKIGEAFAQAAREAQLRVAGVPRITEKADAPAGQLAFDATFEVYPDIKLGDLSSLQIERVSTDITDAAVDRTLEILRKQRATYAQRPQSEPAADGDRVTIDFEGRIDGVPFDGGKADGFQFNLGEGRMLEQFEKAVRGMKAGESKTFPLKFPDDYQGREVAGKEADFLVTVKKVEALHLPAVDDAFATSMGIADGTVQGLREDIRGNLAREVKFRVAQRNKLAVMDALAKAAELELPRTLVSGEVQRMVDEARASLKSRGVKDADTAPIPVEMFQQPAERRVRLGLVVAELVRLNNLHATAEQVRAHVEELSRSYERPADVMRWYYSDEARIAEVQALVVENNVTQFALSRAQVVDKTVPFDELMGN